MKTGNHSATNQRDTPSGEYELRCGRSSLVLSIAIAHQLLPNIADLISYGHITVGVLHPTGCVAIAHDGDHTLAMLLRRPDETMAQLLARLDQTIDKAIIEDIYTDEINSPA